MSGLTNKLQEFTDFLKTVDLKGYRQKYSKIKILEMDMPKNIQAISLLYKVYWSEKTLLTLVTFINYI